MRNLHTSTEVKESNSALLKLARTQIYLTALHQTALTRMAKDQACAKSELIRQALDIFIADQANLEASAHSARMSNRTRAIGLMNGMWADRPEMTDASRYVRGLRDERRF